jgi:acetyltransferase-like isoleucine patch superfamily enzyme
MAGKMLSTESAVDPTASVRDCHLGAYTEVGARSILLEVTMADYSYVVNDAQITYTTIGKFCSIAAMTRINPGNHPMHRASQAHFTYRASSYFFRVRATTPNSSHGGVGITSISATTSGSVTARSSCPAARSAPARWSRPAPS